MPFHFRENLERGLPCPPTLITLRALVDEKRFLTTIVYIPKALKPLKWTQMDIFPHKKAQCSAKKWHQLFLISYLNKDVCALSNSTRTAAVNFVATSSTNFPTPCNAFKTPFVSFFSAASLAWESANTD